LKQKQNDRTQFFFYHISINPDERREKMRGEWDKRKKKKKGSPTMTHVAPPAKARHAFSNPIMDGSVPSTETGTCTNITWQLDAACWRMWFTRKTNCLTYPPWPIIFVWGSLLIILALLILHQTQAERYNFFSILWKPHI